MMFDMTVKYGRLTPIAPAVSEGKGAATICRCDCGAERPFKNYRLKNGTAQSCGCSRLGRPSPQALRCDLTGQTFGKLTVRSQHESGYVSVCDCECGTTEFPVRNTFLLRGKIKSCGCVTYGKLRLEQALVENPKEAKEGEKVCSSCGKSKPITNFRPTGIKWRVSRCRECERGGRQCSCGNFLMGSNKICPSCLRRKNREREGYARGCSVESWLKAKHHSLGKMRTRIIRVEITLKDLLVLWEKQGGLCAVTGMPMTTRKADPRNASVDRIDSAGHYTLGNVMLTCKWVNLGRGAATIEEFKKVLGELPSRG